MKRSRSILLVLSGALTGASFTGCSPEPEAVTEPLVREDLSYTNNQFVPGVGYYHAPYRAWFPRPYNFHDPVLGYYHGNFWTPAPHVSRVWTSQPSPEAVEAVNTNRVAARTGSSGGTGSRFFRPGSGGGSSPSEGHSISRSGFGSSSHSSSSSS